MKKKNQKKLTGAASASASISTPTAPEIKAGLQVESKPKRKAEHLAKYRFKPGVSGNPAGKPKGAVNLTATLRRLLARGDIAEKLVASIVEGVLKKQDSQLARLIFDRIDGSLRERMELCGNIVAPVSSPAEVVIILPDNNRGTVYPNATDIAGVTVKPALPPVAVVKTQSIAEQEEREQTAQLQVKPVPPRPAPPEPPAKIHESNLTALKPSGPKFSGFGG